MKLPVFMNNFSNGLQDLDVQSAATASNTFLPKEVNSNSSLEASTNHTQNVTLDMGQNSNQPNTKTNSDQRYTGSSRGSGSNSSKLTSALVAPPPPPPPPENSSQGTSHLTQGRSGHSLQPNSNLYNHPMAEVNSPQSWSPGFGPGTNNQYNQAQQYPVTGAFGNEPSGWMGQGSAGYTPSGGNYNRVGINPASIGDPNMINPYGSNAMFPNQTQGPPRYW